MRPLAILLLIGICYSSRASADDEASDDSSPGLVTLDLSACTSGNVDLIRTVVQLELGDLLSVNSTPESIATSVQAECRDNTVKIRVNDEITGKRLERALVVTDLPSPNASRVVGLAIAELVASSWVELELERQHSQADVPVPNPVLAQVRAFVGKRVRAPQEPPAKSWHPGLHVRISNHSTGLNMVGMGASASHDWTEHVEISATGDYVKGSQSGNVGEVHAQSTTAGAEIRRRLRLNHLDLLGGLGLRIGAVTLRGQDDSSGLGTPTSFTSPWAGGVLSFAGRLRVASTIRVEIGAEYGSVLLGVSARVFGRLQPQVEGRWFGATTGVSIDL